MHSLKGKTNTHVHPVPLSCHRSEIKSWKRIPRIISELHKFTNRLFLCLRATTQPRSGNLLWKQTSHVKESTRMNAYFMFFLFLVLKLLTKSPHDRVPSLMIRSGRPGLSRKRGRRANPLPRGQPPEAKAWMLNSSQINTSKYSSTTPFIQPWETSIGRLGWSIFLISYCLPTDYTRACSCIKSVCFLSHKNSNYDSEHSGVKLLAGSGLALPGSVRGSRGLLEQSSVLHRDAGGLLEKATCCTRRYSLCSSTHQRRVRGKSINLTSSELQSWEPDRFCREPSAHHRREGKERKSESATLNVKVFFPDLEETQQLQSWSYQNGRRYFWEQLAWHD